MPGELRRVLAVLLYKSSLQNAVTKAMQPRVCTSSPKRAVAQDPRLLGIPEFVVSNALQSNGKMSNQVAETDPQPCKLRLHNSHHLPCAWIVQSPEHASPTYPQSRGIGSTKKRTTHPWLEAAKLQRLKHVAAQMLEHGHILQRYSA